MYIPIETCSRWAGDRSRTNLYVTLYNTILGGRYDTSQDAR